MNNEQTSLMSHRYGWNSFHVTGVETRSSCRSTGGGDDGRTFDPAAEKAGLPGLTPHELRHTAASLAVAAGANVKAVQQMLGHASAAMTLDV
jgi:hypothetical protein